MELQALWRAAGAAVRGATKGAWIGAHTLAGRELAAHRERTSDAPARERATEERRPRRRGTTGFTGPTRYSRLQLDDYNPDLRGKAALRTYERMRRSDGQVRAIQTVTELPIRATRWHLEPPKQASFLEREAAELLTGNLFGGMRGSFDELLREVLRARYFGFGAPEIEWVERAGRAEVFAVHSRNPELIDSWLYDARGQLVGYLMVGERVTGSGLADAPATLTETRAIVPLSRCIHAAYEAEHGSPTGSALARSMYTHWYFKQAIYRLGGIGLERNWLGTPVGKADVGASWDDREEVLEILSRLRAAEDSAIALPAGWALEWYEPRRNLADIMPFLNHHDALMARAALAQFLNLGQAGSEGSQALASEHVKLFLDGEDAVARWVAETLNQQLVRRWCRMNYGERLRPPKLRHRPIRANSLEGTARALQTLQAGGFVTPTQADEAHIRAVAELPEIEESQVKSAR